MLPLKHAHPVQTERGGEGGGGGSFIGILVQEAAQSDILLHVCLSDYFKGE